MRTTLALLPVALLIACGPTEAPAPDAAADAAASADAASADAAATEAADPAATEAPSDAAPSETTQPGTPSTTTDAADAAMSPAQPGLLTEAEFAALHRLKGDAAPASKGEMISLGAGKAYLSLPKDADGPVPGVIVIHEWWGLNDHIKHWTDRLAASGYAAIAVDLYGGAVATTPADAMAAMKKVEAGDAMATLANAHDFLVRDERIQAPKTGVVGWCFGGGWSLRTAMQLSNLDAAVVYYGRIPEDLSGLDGLNAPVLGVFGTQDEGIPVASVEAFAAKAKEAGKSVDIHFYDAPHAFANPSSDRYVADAADDAWTKAKAFLAANLGS